MRAGPAVPICFIAAWNPGQRNPSVNLMNDMPLIGPGIEPFDWTVEPGGWFAAYSNLTSQASIFFSRGAPMLLQISQGAPITSTMPRILGYFNASTAEISAGQELVYELAQLGCSLKTSVKSLNDVTSLVDYLAAPTGLTVIRGTRRQGPAYAGLLEMLPDVKDQVVEVTVGAHPDPEMQLPLRSCGFNRRWTVGNWQVAGFAGAGHYKDDAGGGTSGNGRYTELGIDDLNCTHVPIYVGRSPHTQMLIGHPVVAVGVGASNLFIQVTRLLLLNGSLIFHVAVNNPTNEAVAVTLTSAGFSGGHAVTVLSQPTRTVTVQAGEHIVIQ